MTLDPTKTLHAWTRLWNGDLAVAHEICAEGMTIFLGRAEPDGSNPADALVGPQALADFIGEFRAARPGIRYSEVRLVPGDGHAVALWNADWAELHVGGIDVFDLAGDGRIRRVWSVTGQRHVIP